MPVHPANVIVLSVGPHLAEGLPEERCVRTAEARAALPAGTITIAADDCTAVAVGDGTFKDTGLEGTFPADESVALPAYIVAGPGLPAMVPGGSTLASQDEVDAIGWDITAVDAAGTLLDWWAGEPGFEARWEAAGQVEPATPVFPVIAWA